MDDQRLYKYRGYTLVDITSTGVTTYSQPLEKQRNQQRNWETVQQVLGLRTQILALSQEKLSKQDLKKFNFGDAYKGKQTVWTFEFEIEFADLYKKDDDAYSILNTDFDQTPIILGLDETAKPLVALFYTQGSDKNIYFNLEHH